MKKILSFLLAFTLITGMFTAMPVTASMSSDLNSIISNEYQCTWAYYKGDNYWFISQLEASYNWDVYALEQLNPNASWLTAGTNAAYFNSNLSKITIGRLSHITDTKVYDVGNDKYVTNPYMNIYRKDVENRTLDLKWYFFEADNGLWYIVNDNGNNSEVCRFSSKNGKINWIDIDMDGYSPMFSVKNGKKYVKFTKQSVSSNKPPVLKNYKSMPSQIIKGDAYYIKGEIVSDTPITKVTVSIFNRHDVNIFKQMESAYPNSYKYNLSDIDKLFHFTKFPAGDMEIQIWAVNSAGAFPLIGEYNGNEQIHGEYFTIVDNNSNGKINNVDAMIKYAESFVNSKNQYVYGSNGEKNSLGGVNYDCSSFTQHIYGKYGVTLPRNSTSQSKVGNKVNYTVDKLNKTISGLKKGDLLYFESSNGGHVEIYAGNNMVIHAKGTGKGIVKEKISSWECSYIVDVRRFD